MMSRLRCRSVIAVAILLVVVCATTGVPTFPPTAAGCGLERAEPLRFAGHVLDFVGVPVASTALPGPVTARWIGTPDTWPGSPRAAPASAPAPRAPPFSTSLSA